MLTILSILDARKQQTLSLHETYDARCPPGTTDFATDFIATHSRAEYAFKFVTGRESPERGRGRGPGRGRQGDIPLYHNLFIYNVIIMSYSDLF